MANIQRKAKADDMSGVRCSHLTAATNLAMRGSLTSDFEILSPIPASLILSEPGGCLLLRFEMFLVDQPDFLTLLRHSHRHLE